MVDKTKLGKLLFDYEAAHATELSENKLKGFMVWSIVKPTLYFHLLFEDKGGAEPAGPIIKPASRIKSIVTFFTDLLSAAFKNKDKKAILLYSSSYNKLAKNNEGLFFNFITDPYVTEGVVENYINLEQSANGFYKEPALVATDLKLDGLFALSFLERKFIPKDKISIQATNLSLSINRYFKENNVELTVDKEIIDGILVNFYTDYLLNSFLLKILKPKLIITSEKIGSGLFGAAINLGIKRVDVQHGLMDPYDGMYKYAPELAPFKPNMLLPTELVVWGSHFQDFMVANKFWKENEIRVLGNMKMNAFKAKFKLLNQQSVNLLLPTQWPFFKETMHLLQQLKLVPEKKFHLVLKIHPVEPGEFKKQYLEFAASNKGWLTVAEQDEDIYQIIARSKIVVGFSSASLIEAVKLGVPVITLTTESLNQGVHYYLGNDALKNAIRILNYLNTSELVNLANKAVIDQDFYFNWLGELKDAGENLYANDYKFNAKRQIAELLS
jgi:hypothetical protein